MFTWLVTLVVVVVAVGVVSALALGEPDQPATLRRTKIPRPVEAPAPDHHDDRSLVRSLLDPDDMGDETAVEDLLDGDETVPGAGPERVRSSLALATVTMMVAATVAVAAGGLVAVGILAVRRLVE